MRSVKKYAVAVALVLAAGPAAATNGMRMIGFGPTQNAMGGASVGAPLDAATVVTNPAGLTETGLRLDVGITYFDPTVKYSASGAASGKEQESTRPASYIPTIAFSMPLGDKLAFGVGVVGVAGMGVEYPADLFGSTTKTSYMQLRVAPGVAMKLPAGLSAGLTLNAGYAMMEYAVAGSAPPNGPGMQPRKQAGAMGVGATVGLQWSPLPIVTVGAAYETKSNFKDFEFDIPAHQLATQQGMVSIPGGTEKLAFDQPAVLTVGGMVKPLPGFTVAADVEYVFWSQTNGKDQPKFTTDPNMTGAMAFNMNWDDQLVLKVGAELPVFPLVKLRVGYNHGKMPLDATRAFENVAFPAIAENHYTAGLQVKVGPVAVNAAAVYSPEAKLAGAQALQGISAYETKMSQIAIDLGASMSF
ncbi:MAG: outer membrane protein transport protein [Anaeromyxobacter sp.]